MLKRVLAGLAVAAVLATPALAFDTEAAPKSEPAQEEQKGRTGSSNFLGLALGLGLGVAAFGGALGQSGAIRGAVEAVARQPEAGGRIQGMMIIGLALIETLVIYMLLICFMWGGKIV